MSAEQVEARISGLIAEHGFAVICVPGGSPKKTFGYTVGLTKVGQPEFLVRGVCQEDVLMMLHRLAHDVLRGEYYAHGHTAEWKGGQALYFAAKNGAGKYALDVYRRYGMAAKVLEAHVVDRELLGRVCAKHLNEVLEITE